MTTTRCVGSAALRYSQASSKPPASTSIELPRVQRTWSRVMNSCSS
jgi:hypothetical protein